MLHSKKTPAFHETLTRGALSPTKAIAAMAALCAGCTALGQFQPHWRITPLTDPDPSQWSVATCVHGNRQGGKVDDGYSHGRVWNNTKESVTSLVDPGPDAGPIVTSISDTQAAGYGYIRTSEFDGYYAALLWNAAGDQVSIIEVPGGLEPQINGIYANTQVGSVRFIDSNAPVLWHGTTESWQDLSPPGMLEGEALGIDANTQVGWVYIDQTSGACLWRGDRSSFVSLHPQGWQESVAMAVSADMQAGGVYSEEAGGHACIWRGTSASFVDIHPAGYERSQAQAVCRGQLAGTVSLPNGYDRAGYWPSASASAFVDLQNLLPLSVESSEAMGIWVDDDGTVKIVGSMQYGAPNYETVAVMWRLCPSGTCCEIDMSENNYSLDTNGDLIADACDGTDCNGNGIPDLAESLDVTVTTFSGDTSDAYFVNGTASVVDETAQLTPAEYSQMGSIVRPPLLDSPLTRLLAVFDFQATHEEPLPADGFSFALLDAAFFTPDIVWGEDGPGPNSIAVKFNTYSNYAEEGDNSMEIRYNGALIARQTVLPFRIADDNWHRASVELTPTGRVTVRVATVSGDAATIFDAVQLPNYTPFTALIGFGGRTGGAYSRQRIDNIRLGVPSAADADGDGVLDECGSACPADFNHDGGIDGADVESFFAAWEGGDATADVNQDGGVDGADVGTFFAAWEAGGC